MRTCPSVHELTTPPPSQYDAAPVMLSHTPRLRSSSMLDHANIELAQQASQITMYDVKSYYNQAKNAVLNVSEIEAKVREATNDDPWYALPSTCDGSR